MSQPGRLDPRDWKRVFAHWALCMIGAIVVFLFDQLIQLLQQFDWGSANVFMVPFLAALLNIIRKWAGNTDWSRQDE